MTIEYAVADEAFFRQRLREFEDKYGLDSFEFYRLYLAWEVPWRVPPGYCTIWSGHFQDWKEQRRRNGLSEEHF